jgi:endonuclease/exonuclease/phosphatase family metal-dependent hydrolase
MPLTLATYNVKNLLEPATQAARDVLPRKMDHIAGLLRACDADVVGLQEVGSAALVEQLLDRLPSRGGYALHMGTTDARGIGCAVLSRIPVAMARVHTAEALAFPRFREDDPAPFGARIPLRRGVVHARVTVPTFGAVDVFVAHFKSSRAVPARDASGAAIAPATARARAEGSLRSLVWRASEALFVRGLVDEILFARADAYAAALGDFNDIAGSAVLRALRGAGAGAMVDCTTAIDPARRFSHFHDGRPTQIDHVVATAGLHARLRDARFLNEGLREHDPLPEDGREIPTVDSDHAPLVVTFS